MPSFFPSDPNNWWKTSAESHDWEMAENERKAQRKRETRRFIITAVLSGIAAVAAVASVIIQLASMQ